MEHYFNIILLGQSTTRFEVYICPIEKIVSFCFVGVFKKNYKSKNCSIKLCRTWNRNQVIARPRQTRMLLWVSKVEKTTFKSFLRKYLSIRSQEVNHTHTQKPRFVSDRKWDVSGNVEKKFKTVVFLLEKRAIRNIAFEVKGSVNLDAN